jgi:hypothetical protein
MKIVQFLLDYIEYIIGITQVIIKSRFFKIFIIQTSYFNQKIEEMLFKKSCFYKFYDCCPIKK